MTNTRGKPRVTRFVPFHIKGFARMWRNNPEDAKFYCSDLGINEEMVFKKVKGQVPFTRYQLMRMIDIFGYEKVKTLINWEALYVSNQIG